MSSSFWGVNADGSLGVRPGSTIDAIINEAIGLATSREEPLKFESNGVIVTVEADSNPELILRDWNRALSGCVPKTVGPHPVAMLSAEELAHDAEVENEARCQAHHADNDAKAHREHAEARLANAPAMEFSDESAWLDAVASIGGRAFGYGLLAYAERWARLMQLEMSEGKTLEEVWGSTSREAEVERMSGTRQALATHLLIMSWVHGMELRRLLRDGCWADSPERTLLLPIDRAGE